MRAALEGEREECCNQRRKGGRGLRAARVDCERFLRVREQVPETSRAGSCEFASGSCVFAQRAARRHLIACVVGEGITCGHVQ